MTETKKSMRTFYIVWFGQLISTLGSGLTAFAIAVWIFEQTHNATPFILTNFFGNVPYVLLATYAGVLADRLNRRKIMLTADTIAACTTLLALWLFTSGNLEVWHVWALAAMASATAAFQEPAWTAAITQVVPEEQLTRAAGLGQMTQAISAIATPILAGVLYSLIGLGGVIWVDIGTFCFAVVTLLWVRFPQLDRTKSSTMESDNWRENLTAGYRYLRQKRGLFYLICTFAVVNFIANAGAVVIGPLTLSIGDARDFGFVQMASGIGLLIGSIGISVWGGPKGKKLPTIFIALGGLSLGLILAGIIPTIWGIALGFSLGLLLIPVGASLSQSLHQLRVPEDLQGRTFAFSGMLGRILMPISFLIAGPLIDNVFEPNLQANGAWASGWLGSVFGVGAGRGSGLFLSLSGVLLLIFILFAYSHPRIRNLEMEIPELSKNAVAEDG